MSKNRACENLQGTSKVLPDVSNLPPAAIKSLSKKPVSPLKKMKRKVGYHDGQESDTQKGEGEHGLNMKRLCLVDVETAHVTDVNMRS